MNVFLYGVLALGLGWFALIALGVIGTFIDQVRGAVREEEKYGGSRLPAVLIVWGLLATGIILTYVL